MNPRLRRLYADANRIRDEFAGHPHVSVEFVGSEPAERYRITYRLLGVVLDESGQPAVRDTHVVEFQLGADYPRGGPLISTVTSVFHPNMRAGAGGEVCIGDVWTPAQPLADLVMKVGDMIQYRAFNELSPLNADAARWVVAHPEIFPIGSVQLYQPEPEIELDV